MTAWTPLNTLIVVCICVPVVSLCVGGVALVVIAALKGNFAVAQASLNSLEGLAQKAAEVAVQKFFLAHPPQPPTPIIVVPPAEPSQQGTPHETHPS